MMFLFVFSAVSVGAGCAALGFVAGLLRAQGITLGRLLRPSDARHPAAGGNVVSLFDFEAEA